MWKQVANRTAYDISTLVSLASQSKELDTQRQQEILRYVIKHINRANEYYASHMHLHDEKKSLLHSIKEEEAITQHIEIESTNETHTSLKMRSNSSKCSNSCCRNKKICDNKSLLEKIRHKFLQLKCYHHAKLLFIGFLCIKLLYLANCMFQFMLLNQLIATESKEPPKVDEDRNEVISSDITFWNSKNILRGFQFGFKSFQQVYETGNLFDSRSGLLLFHTVIFCDFKIRTLGDRMHNFSVQCAVPINIFLEKIFICMWVWFFVLNFINVFSLIKWLCFFFSYKIRLNFMLRHLNLKNYQIGLQELSKKEKTPEHFKRKVSNLSKIDYDFAHKNINEINRYYVMHENTFLLKLISNNTTEIVTREMINLSLEIFNKKMQFPNEDTV
jgi:hypothetical protein